MIETASYKPAGMQSCIPYFVVPAGTAGDFLQFLKDAFGAVELSRNLRENGDVAHAEMKIDDTTLMVGGTMGADQPAITGAHYVYVPDVDATYKKALVAGATSEGEPVDQPYGDRGGVVKDRWGNVWWIGTKIAS